MITGRFDRIAQIHAARWDRAVAGLPFASHAWLSYGERVHAADRPVYLLATWPDGEETACVCWIRRREQLPVSSGLVRALLDRYFRNKPLVICQTAVAGLSGLFAGEKMAGRPHRIAPLAARLRDVLEEAGGSFLIVPYLDPATAASPAWGEGFLSVAMPPNTYLPVQWPDFKAFTAGLRRSVRKDYRRHRNRVARFRLRTRVDRRPPDGATVLRLVRAVERKHGAAPLPYLERLVAERPVPGAHWILVEREGQPVGCGLMLRDRRWISLTALGLAGEVSNVYFELMYGAIAHAIETRAAGIYGGGGAYSFKSRLGYRQLENNHVLFYARDPRLRRLGAWLAGREAQRPAAFAAAGLSDSV